MVGFLLQGPYFFVYDKLLELGIDEQVMSFQDMCQPAGTTAASTRTTAASAGAVAVSTEAVAVSTEAVAAFAGTVAASAGTVVGIFD